MEHILWAWPLACSSNSTDLLNVNDKTLEWLAVFRDRVWWWPADNKTLMALFKIPLYNQKFGNILNFRDIAHWIMLMNIELLERVISYLVVIRICVLIRHLKQKPWPLLFEQSKNFLQKKKKKKKKTMIE